MSRIARALIIAAILGLGSLPDASAQDGAAAQPDVSAQGEGQTGDGQIQADIEVQRRAQLTPDQQLEEADRVLSRAQRVSQRTAGMLDQSRREKDIIRVTCLNDKLTQINANMRMAERRVEGLRDAVNMNDASRANHEYTVLTVIGQKLQTLEQEANQCIGQDLYEVGVTNVTTEIDAAQVPDTDPAVIPTSPPPAVPTIPPPASGTF